jgi:hypothetical protein
MPPYRFLFEVQEQVDPAETDAVQLPEDYGGGRGWIIPTQRARDLVGYLLSLDQEFALEDVR